MTYYTETDRNSGDAQSDKGSTEESEEYHEVLHPGHFGLSQRASSHHIGLTFDATTATAASPSVGASVNLLETCSIDWSC